MADDSYSSLWSSTDGGAEEAEHEELELELEEDLPDIPLNISDEEVLKLVEKVKCFTTLSNLRQQDWSDETESVIRQFVLYPRNEMLSIYFQKKKLGASLGLPNYAVTDIMFFSKETKVELSPENFHEVIQFVSFSGTVETTVLSITQHVFLPALLKQRSLPQGIRSDFLLKMYSFLSNFIDVRSKLQGYTAIFVPTEMRKYSPAQGAENKELVKQLESMIKIWMRQIRVALSDIVVTGLKNNRYPIDEYNFWIYRFKVLSALQYQLKNKDVHHIIAILTVAQSSFVIQFLSLQDEIRIAMEKAKSNIEYLQILNDPCKDLSEMRDPSSIPKSLPLVIYLCHVIWNHSSYYKFKEQISGLFRNVSNLVIALCRKSISLADILKGNTAVGLKQHQACILCLEKYKALFEKILVTQAEKLGEVRELDKGLIFNHVDSFIQRCREMIAVCEAMQVFGRMSEVEKISKPTFGGTHGPQFERIVEKVENNFKRTLDKVIEVEDSILEVQDSTWPDVISYFNNEIKGLEVAIGNMITALFEKNTNVEEGLQNLQAVYHYSKRPALTLVYEKSVERVYKVFGEDVEDTRRDVLEGKLKYPTAMPFHSGRAMIAVLKKSRLNRLYSLLESAKWLPISATAKEVIEQYKRICCSIDHLIGDFHTKWIDSLATEEVLPRFDRPLLCYSFMYDGCIEPNLDRMVLSIEQEVRYWRLMRFIVPKHILRLMPKLREVKILYENVLSLCIDYNQVITALSSDEQFLFRELIRICHKRFQQGFSLQKWSTDGSDLFIEECHSHILQLQKSVDDFKDSNIKILRICEKICDSSLVDLNTNESYSIQDFQDALNNSREKVLTDIMSHLQDIQNCLVHIYEGFEEQISFMKQPWTNYLQRIDAMVEEALTICIRESLSVLLVVINGDNSSGPSPLLNVTVSLSGNEIIFEPLLATIAETITKVFPNCVMNLQSVPRILEQFLSLLDGKASYSEIVLQDKECRKLQRLLVKGECAKWKNEAMLFNLLLLNVEVENMVQKVQEYLKRWEPLRNIWEMEKDLFINHYQTLKPPVCAFESDITQYIEIANNVRLQESIRCVHFLIIDSSRLKHVIVDHCLKWQSKLHNLLFHLFTTKLNDLYKYISDNSIKAVREPQSLHELQDTLLLHKQLTEEISDQEEEFPIIRDQFNVLTKFNIDVPEDLLNKLQNLDTSWEKYLEILDNMFIMIERSKERFRNNLLGRVEKLKWDSKELLNEFRESSLFNIKEETDETYTKRMKFREAIKQFHDNENELRELLAIFSEDLSDNLYLKALEDDLDAIEKKRES